MEFQILLSVYFRHNFVFSYLLEHSMKKFYLNRVSHNRGSSFLACVFYVSNSKATSYIRGRQPSFRTANLTCFPNADIFCGPPVADSCQINQKNHDQDSRSFSQVWDIIYINTSAQLYITITIKLRLENAR